MTSPSGTADNEPAEPPKHVTNIVVQDNAVSSADLLKRLLDIEQQRIDSINRRTDVTLQAIRTNDEADRRQLEFEDRQRSSADEADRRRRSLAQVVVYELGLFGCGDLVASCNGILRRDFATRHSVDDPR
jgi:hypothetical protein